MSARRGTAHSPVGPRLRLIEVYAAIYAATCQVCGYCGRGWFWICKRRGHAGASVCGTCYAVRSDG